MKLRLFLVLVTAAVCCERHRPQLRIATGPAAVTFAQDGRLDLGEGGVNFLAELGSQLRQLAGAPIEGISRKRLVEEAFYLLAATNRKESSAAQEITEMKYRILAQVYLRRLAEALERMPVSEEQIEQAHRLEIRRAMGFEGSDIFVPERIDAVAAIVGYFPDLHVPERNEKMIFEKKRLKELAEEIFRMTSGMRSLDGFIGRVRALMADHPTLQIKEYWQLPLWPAPETLNRTLHQTLVNIVEDGKVGPPVETDFGFVVPFSAGGKPGRGKDLDEVRQQIEQLVREQRRKELVQEHIEELLQKYQAKKFYENIIPRPNE